MIQPDAKIDDTLHMTISTVGLCSYAGIMYLRANVLSLTFQQIPETGGRSAMGSSGPGPGGSLAAPRT